MTRDHSTRPTTGSTVRFLRRVDGISHLVLGPVALGAVRPAARVLGVPERRLAAFLAAFTAYGGVVVACSRPAQDPARLFGVVTAGNVAFLICVLTSGVRHRLTRTGLVAHVAVAASAMAVGVRALTASRRRR